LPLSPVAKDSSFSFYFLTYAERTRTAWAAADFFSATDCNTSLKRWPIAGQS
jgi:hypothetical protein